MSIYVKFGHINGDATLDGHAGWVAADSFGWSGGARAAQTAANQRQSRVAFQPAVVGKKVDSATALLMQTMAHNQTLEQVSVRFVNAALSADEELVCEIIFSNARVTDINYAATDSIMGETVAINFEEFEVTYYDTETGSGQHSFSHQLRPSG
ncbi:MAG: type VI secretion system tube protein Hcp [Pseudomonadota bacterium]